MAKKSRVVYRRASRPKFRRKQKFTLPVAVVSGFIPAAVGVWNRRSSPTEIGNYLQAGFTGITPGTGQFNFANLRSGLIPVVGGFMVHLLASKLGVNRAIARAGIPLVRI